MVDGLARFDRLSPASLARALRSSMVSPGLLIFGRIDSDFSNSLPISLIRPGFSSRAGAGGGAPSLGGDAACGGGSRTPSAGGDDVPCVPCDQAALAAITIIDTAAPAVTTAVMDRTMRLPDRAIMTSSVTLSGEVASTSRPPSDHSKGDDKSEHENNSEKRYPQPKALLDLGTDGIAITVEQDRDSEEPAAAGDDRTQYEQPDIVAGKARCDGHELVGNRRQTLADDDPGAPLRIAGAEGLDLVAKAIEIDQPMPDRVIEHGADRVAEYASGNRSNRAQGCKQPGPLRPCQRHRKQHDIRRHRKE